MSYEVELTDREFELLRETIYKITGIALSPIKKQLVKSRLQKRLRHHGLTRFMDYYELVRSLGNRDPEITELTNAVTTNKTDFFREEHHFEFIRSRVVPEAVQHARTNGTLPKLSIWHAGCSTGEEPYTLGMVLSDALRSYPGWSYRQLASDIDTNVIAHAQRGRYAPERVETIPKQYLAKYFDLVNEDGSRGYQIREDLTKAITFRQINLVQGDWPLRAETKFDIIFCRNVIIYFDRPTQQRLFERFQERLKPGGYLFIGHSESLHGVSDAFQNLGKTIYQLPAQRSSLRQAA